MDLEILKILVVLTCINNSLILMCMAYNKSKYSDVVEKHIVYNITSKDSVKLRKDMNGNKILDFQIAKSNGKGLITKTIPYMDEVQFLQGEENKISYIEKKDGLLGDTTYKNVVITYIK